MADPTPEQDVIQVYSTVWCPDCKRAKQFFGEQRIAYQNHDIEHDPQAMALVEKINHGKHIIPTILFFVVAYVLFRRHLPLPVVLAASFGVWLAGAAVHQYFLK